MKFDSKKPWVDVGTMVVARFCVGRCIRSLLEHFADRDRYRLRWICHLDQYGTGILEHAWKKQLDEIVDASDLFDDFTLIANRSHVGYGGSLFRILREVRHPLFYTDDDQLFRKDISLSDALDSGCDHYNWHNTLMGSTVPSYWSPRFVAHMLENFPSNHRRVTELALLVMARLGTFKGNRIEGVDMRDQWPSGNIGRAPTKAVGGQIGRYGPHRRYINQSGEIKNVPKGNNWADALTFANEEETDDG